MIIKDDDDDYLDYGTHTDADDRVSISISTETQHGCLFRSEQREDVRKLRDALSEVLTEWDAE